LKESEELVAKFKKDLIISSEVGEEL